MSNSKAGYISSVAMLSSLAAVMTLLKLEVPYPLIPYLKFDFAEIPSAIALLMYDLKTSSLVALVHLLILMIRGEFVPLGPLMKFAAVISTLLGFHPSLIGRKNVNLRRVIFGMMTAIVARCIIMTLANYLVLTLLMPDLIKATSSLLRRVVDMRGLDDLAYILIFTGLYNAMHVIMTIGLAFIIFKHVKNLIPSLH